MTSEEEKKKLGEEESEEEAIDGRGGHKPGGGAEVKGPGSAAPRPREIDRSIETKNREVRKETSHKRKKKELREEEEVGEDMGGGGRSGSGGHKPGGTLEVKPGQYSGPETREEGFEGCRSLRGFIGKEMKDVQWNKIDGAGGVKPGQEDEEARGSKQ